MRKLLRHLWSVLKYTLLAGFLLPILNFENLVETWLNPYYWFFCLVGITISYAVHVYCTEINPRTFCPCVSIGIAVAVYVLAIFAFIIACFTSLMIENIFFEILLIVSTVVAGVLAAYILCCRGVMVYENGKIVVFDYGFKVKIFADATLDQVTFEHKGRKCLVNFIINGEDHTFLLPKSSLEILEKRVKLSKIS